MVVEWTDLVEGQFMTLSSEYQACLLAHQPVFVKWRNQLTRLPLNARPYGVVGEHSKLIFPAPASLHLFTDTVITL